MASLYPKVSKALENCTPLRELIFNSPETCEKLVKSACRYLPQISNIVAAEIEKLAVKSPLLADFNSCRQRDALLGIGCKITTQYWEKIKEEFRRLPGHETSAITESANFDCEGALKNRKEERRRQQSHAKAAL